MRRTAIELSQEELSVLLDMSNEHRKRRRQEGQRFTNGGWKPSDRYFSMLDAMHEKIDTAYENIKAGLTKVG